MARVTHVSRLGVVWWLVRVLLLGMARLIGLVIYL